MTTGPDPAAARFAIIQAVRLSGAALAILGILVLSRRVSWLAPWPDSVGYLLAGIGLADFFVVPAVLARRWRSPK